MLVSPYQTQSLASPKQLPGLRTPRSGEQMLTHTPCILPDSLLMSFGLSLG